MDQVVNLNTREKRGQENIFALSLYELRSVPALKYRG